MSSTLPTHRFKVLDKVTGAKHEVGAGWINADGSISIRLNPCVVIHANPDQVLTLFPCDRPKKKGKLCSESSSSPSA